MINFSIIQVSFRYILKISAIKSIKISVTTIAKITDRNAGMRNVLNCQITSIRKMSAKLCNFFPNFCKIFLERFVWTLDVGKFRTIMLSIAKARILLVKKGTSDVLSSNIVRNGWEVIYVFKLERKNLPFRVKYTVWKMPLNKLIWTAVLLSLKTN